MNAPLFFRLYAVSRLLERGHKVRAIIRPASPLPCWSQNVESVRADLRTDNNLVAAFSGIDAPRGEADDLKRISGITGKIEQNLNDLGVYHFWQLADADAAAVAVLDKLLGTRGRVARDDWVGQAKKLTEEAAA